MKGTCIPPGSHSVLGPRSHTNVSDRAFVTSSKEPFSLKNVWFDPRHTNTTLIISRKNTLVLAIRGHWIMNQDNKDTQVITSIMSINEVHLHKPIRIVFFVLDSHWPEFEVQIDYPYIVERSLMLSISLPFYKQRSNFLDLIERK